MKKGGECALCEVGAAFAEKAEGEIGGADSHQLYVRPRELKHLVGAQAVALDDVLHENLRKL